MHLVAHRRRVLRRAWSVRLMIVAALVSGAEVALPLLDGVFPLDRGVFAGLSFLAPAGAFVRASWRNLHSRETTMARTSKTRLATGIAGLLTGAGALAVATIGQFEGLRLVAYQDVVGVWTACYGETKGIKPGMKFTREQCDVMFIERLQEFETGMRRCLAAPDALPDKTYVSFLSVTYNIGVGGWCGSSMVRRANEGNLTGACDALLMWNKAGDQVKRLKELETENSRLRRAVSDLTLDKMILAEAARGNS